jgi:large repetitive protein
MVLLFLSITIAAIPLTSSAGSITLTPSAQAPGGSVTVTGTGFAASKPIGVGIGSEITVTGENHTPTGTGTGPWMTATNRYPIKPGSVTFLSNVVGSSETTFTDKGDGTFSTSSTYDAGSYLNYVTGAFGRSSTMDLSSSELIFTASYKHYQYNVTMPATTTTATGTCSFQFTLPASIPNGNYVVTVLDTAGNTATATLTVDNTIPEGFSLIFIIVLSAVAVVVGTRFFKKQPKNSQLALNPEF